MKKMKCSKSFFLHVTGPLEINKVDTLDINKSAGTNSIPVYILKNFKQFFSSKLSKIINLTYLKLLKLYPFIRKVTGSR